MSYVYIEINKTIYIDIWFFYYSNENITNSIESTFQMHCSNNNINNNNNRYILH